jgi:hypothetical protein
MRPTKDRRRTKRHEVEWTARYSAGSPGAWYPCKALDVSEAGAGLILFGAPIPIGGSLTLEVQVDDGTAHSILLHATVTNATPCPDGAERVGVEFAPLTRFEVLILTLLIERAAAIASR